MKLTVRLSAAILAACAVLLSCSARQTPLSRTEFVLGTSCTITLFDHAAAENLDTCFQRLHEIDGRMSANAPGSEVDMVNQAAGKAPVRVTDDFFAVMARAMELAKLSNGLFNPSVGPLVKLWGINTDHARVPSPPEIAAARRLVGWRDVVLDPTARTVFLKRPLMSLDVGGIAKGYAADEMVRILGARGVKSALIDLGGNIFAMGSKPDGRPWRIGIQDPDAPRGTSFGVATVVNMTVVTSGVYERFFIQDGKRYHHIMDTRTGSPVDNGLASVTVIADRSFAADGLTLSLFSLGPSKGMALARQMGLEVIMVGADHRVYATPGARAVFTITEAGFAYAD